MKNYAVFNKAGVILRTGSCPDDVIKAQALPGEYVIEGEADDRTHYIDQKGDSASIIEKLSFKVPHTVRVPADGGTAVYFANLPIPTKAIVTLPWKGRQEYILHDGICEMTFDYPGRYTLILQAPHYKDAQVAIDAN